MTNKDKFKEVFGFEPDTETMIPVCPPRGVECPFMDDGIYSECHCELWWGREYKALEQEPTTKNDLGVDAVSRQAVLDLIADYDLSMGQVIKGVHALTSVTPQEPCDKCEVGNPCLYCKHEFEPQEREVADGNDD